MPLSLKHSSRRQGILLFAAVFFALTLSDAASVTTRGNLVALRERLGTERRLSMVVWDPRPILNTPYFFSLAVEAGVDTVWIAGYPFRQISWKKKQEILSKASEAGLKTLGFIDGNYDWPEQREFVRTHSADLTHQLSRLDLGNLRIAFATNVEPYVIPRQERKAGRTWSGDLSSYMDLLDQVTLPELQAFADKKTHPDGRSVVSNPLLTRFEPWWYQNGKRTDSGVLIRGLRSIRNTEIAAMTYRNTAQELRSVSEIVRQRAREEGVTFQIGVETIPSQISETPSFAGQEILIGRVLLEAIDGISPEDGSRLGGVFIHTKNPVEAYRILSILVHGKLPTVSDTGSGS